MLFAAGVLAGANAVYFWTTRDTADPGAALAFDRDRTQHGTDAPSPPRGPAQTGARTLPPRSPGKASGRTREPVATAAAPSPPAKAVHPPGPGPESRTTAPTPDANGLIVPVQGVSRQALHDTFQDARGSDRSHEALDIMAARGTPVVAAIDGRIEKLFDSVPGGLTIYQFDQAGRHAYYYAHLDRYAAGLEEGDTVVQGQVIGYVGSTGNASDDAPHLHFAIFVLGPEKHWWEGTAVNPYPLLAGREAP
nr:M23 family metallopeptidase [Lysobacter sp. GX 14042]